MRTDPRKACANEQQRTGWAFVHDALCHPLMALTCWSSWSLAFHDWTSFRAWPRVMPARPRAPIRVFTRHWGILNVVEVDHRFWSIDHPRVLHTLRVMADDAIQAAEQAERWFDDLAQEHGGNFTRVS